MGTGTVDMIMQHLDISHCSESDGSNIERVCDEVNHIPPFKNKEVFTLLDNFGSGIL